MEEPERYKTLSEKFVPADVPVPSVEYHGGEGGGVNVEVDGRGIACLSRGPIDYREPDVGYFFPLYTASPSTSEKYCSVT